MTAEELIQQAQAILTAEDLSIDKKLDAIEVYSTNFRAFEEAGGLQEMTAEPLQNLSALHGEVLVLATKLLSGLSGDLQALQTRGQAVLKYLDTLPKRISSVKPKKG